MISRTFFFFVARLLVYTNFNSALIQLALHPSTSPPTPSSSSPSGQSATPSPTNDVGMRSTGPAAAAAAEEEEEDAAADDACPLLPPFPPPTRHANRAPGEAAQADVPGSSEPSGQSQ